MTEYIKKSDVLAYPIRRDNYDKVNGNAHFVNGVESVMEYVEGLPAADVAEIRHGKWVQQNGFVMCNQCGASPAYWEAKPNNPRGFPPFCHECGAIMDKEGEQ